MTVTAKKRKRWIQCWSLFLHQPYQLAQLQVDTAKTTRVLTQTSRRADRDTSRTVPGPAAVLLLPVPTPNGGGAFAKFLKSIGVDPSLSVVFAECNFRTERDLIIMKNYPAKTLDRVLEAIKVDGRIALKEWGLIHAALRR